MKETVCKYRSLARSLALRYHGTAMDESALIRLAQDGDLDAFNRLVVAHQTRAYNLAYRIMGDQESAADVTQEAFISAFRNVRRFRGGSFKAWIMRIITNACYDEFRRRKRRAARSLEELGPNGLEPEAESLQPLVASQQGPETEAEQAELARAIQDCLDRLPEDFRAVAVLSDVQGYAYQEAAKILGTPVGTVKSRLARARARMRDCLQRYRELLPSAFRLKGEALR
jgi:RNA polymerase sigma-70 factor (ECF subfamily)